MVLAHTYNSGQAKQVSSWLFFVIYVPFIQNLPTEFHGVREERRLNDIIGADSEGS